MGAVVVFLRTFWHILSGHERVKIELFDLGGAMLHRVVQIEYARFCLFFTIGCRAL